MHFEIDVSAGSYFTITVPVEVAPILDLEVSGLDTTTFYDLQEQGSGENWSSYSNSGGVAVFWALPTDDWTWDLIEGATTIASIAIDVIVDVPAEDGPSVFLCECPKRVTYTPDSQRYLNGKAIAQAAFSWSDEAVVETTSCFGHVARVEASFGVSAGGGKKSQVSGNAGGDYQFEQEYCDTITSRLTNGDSAQTVEKQGMDFQYDTYDDFSTKFYATGTSWGISINSIDLPASLVKDDGTTYKVVEVDPFQTVVRDVTEKRAGSVFFSTGASATLAPGIVLETEVRFSATDTWASTVKLSITNNEPTTRYWQVRFVSGNQYTTGLVGMVCECEQPFC